MAIRGLSRRGLGKKFVERLRNGDLARLGFLTLAERYRQDALVQFGLNGGGIDGWRQGEAALEA